MKTELILFHNLVYVFHMTQLIKGKWNVFFGNTCCNSHAFSLYKPEMSLPMRKRDFVFKQKLYLEVKVEETVS